jgi:hypothetical protein
VPASEVGPERLATEVKVPLAPSVTSAG